MRVSALIFAMIVASLGCADDGGGPLDAATGDLSKVSDRALALAEAGEAGAAASAVNFVAQGCTQRTDTTCEGHVPLRLTFSAVLPGGTPTVSWDLGDKSGSKPGLLVTHTYAEPGDYDVTLSVSATGGTVSETKPRFVRALPAEPGSACASASACASKTCVCAPGSAVPCAFPLDSGLCLQTCKLAPCPVRTSGGPGFACVNLGLGVSAGKTAPAWRAEICLPGCTKGGTCRRPGFACKLSPVAGGWTWACVPPPLGETGAPCRAAGGALDGARCLGGECLAIGAAGYCSASCKAGTCPEGTRCARFNGEPQEAVCLASCAASAGGCKGDPALGCEAPGAAGPFGFKILGAPPAAGTTFCAPRRCTSDGQCGLTGVCKPAGSGFCSAM